MKRFLYILCVTISLASLNACKKNADPVPDPVVGSWKLDRIRTGGFVAPFTSVYPNGDNDPSGFDYQDSFTVKMDKTYTGTLRTSGRVIDYNGTWDYSSNTLTLKDSQGNSDAYTLDATKTPTQLLSTAAAVSDTLTNPTTKKGELVKYTVQLVYLKQ